MIITHLNNILYIGIKYMRIIKSINEIRTIINQWKKNGLSIGLVPTMGYLHKGHGALIQESVKNNNKTIVSVFVNPTQFGANEDLDKYPRDIENDSRVVEEYGGDIIFNPEPEEMYNKNMTKVFVESLSNKLCGITRPTHFQGVCLVVAKLFNIITPNNAYFGLKDLQQFTIIKQMVEDLNFNIKINPVAIVREESGLALSSRNVYLKDEDEKQSALSLNKSLNLALKLIHNGECNVNNIINHMKAIILEHNNTKIDYIKIVDSNTLEDIDIIKDNNFYILLAVYVGTTRLIDNYSNM